MWILLLIGFGGQRICMIGIPPKSCRSQKIFIKDKVIIIVYVCSQII